MIAGVILGMGSDLCDIRRIEQMLTKHGTRFTHRVFSDAERARCERFAPLRAASYAKRFAAKEACAKALGTGFTQGVVFADMQVVNQPGGQPVLQLSGVALEKLLEMTPKNMSPKIFLSLTDEYPYALAQVILSAQPA